MPPTGRPPAYIQQRRLAQAILGKEGTPEFKEYVDTMRRHVLAGICPPALHQLFLHYGYGKPVEEIQVSEGPSSMANLTEDELRDRARRLAMAKFILPPPEEDEETPSSEPTEPSSAVQ